LHWSFLGSRWPTHASTNSSCPRTNTRKYSSRSCSLPSRTLKDSVWNETVQHRGRVVWQQLASDNYVSSYVLPSCHARRGVCKQLASDNWCVLLSSCHTVLIKWDVLIVWYSNHRPQADIPMQCDICGVARNVFRCIIFICRHCEN